MDKTENNLHQRIYKRTAELLDPLSTEQLVEPFQLDLTVDDLMEDLDPGMLTWTVKRESSQVTKEGQD